MDAEPFAQAIEHHLYGHGGDDQAGNPDQRSGGIPGVLNQALTNAQQSLVLN